MGNVFICEDEDGQKMCKLGGYDQTLLGYRPRLYRDILGMNLLEHIDVIMFGEDTAIAVEPVDMYNHMCISMNVM